jgi:hypothetical protein
MEWDKNAPGYIRYEPELEQPSVSSPIKVVEKRDRTTFTAALEEAFWQAGGLDYLLTIAKKEPLEFLKVAAKLIPADIKQGVDGALVINIVKYSDEKIIIEDKK